MRKGMKKNRRRESRRTEREQSKTMQLFREANGEAGGIQHRSDIAHDAENIGMENLHFMPRGSAAKRVAKLINENFRAIEKRKVNETVLVYREVFPKAEPFQGVGDQGWSFGQDLRRKLLRMLCEEREKRLQGLTHQSKV